MREFELLICDCRNASHAVVTCLSCDFNEVKVTFVWKGKVLTNLLDILHCRIHSVAYESNVASLPRNSVLLHHDVLHFACVIVCVSVACAYRIVYYCCVLNGVVL